MSSKMSAKGRVWTDFGIKSTLDSLSILATSERDGFSKSIAKDASEIIRELKATLDADAERERKIQDAIKKIEFQRDLMAIGKKRYRDIVSASKLDAFNFALILLTGIIPVEDEESTHARLENDGRTAYGLGDAPDDASESSAVDAGGKEG